MPLPPLFVRHPENPIVVPGLYDWRMAVTFNPGVLRDDDGRYYLYERAAGQFRPFFCAVGLLTSDDGVHFTHVTDRPVFTPEMAGSAHGSVQDPRVAKIDDLYYMTFAFRPFAWSSHPTGVGVPESHESDFPGVERAAPDASGGSANVQGARPDNMTRSGLAVSEDRVHWRFHSWITGPDLDDRDVILFPERIGGRYAVLRRPLQYVGEAYGTTGPSMWLSYSDDLRAWTDPVLVAKAEYGWEDNRIGGSTPPMRTDAGWLVLYHGVQTLDAAAKRVCYRLGGMLLDLEDPTKVLARTAEPIMEPETYYERFGAYIPNVIFPTANVVTDGTIYLYYGVCDTAISLATAPLDAVVERVLRG
ncbi:MAG TPA: hypothetical protein VM490_03500 [Armatimonadaceae bacterium]|nr:hypothetical protein [Armatimonadaceae bacterium]